MYAIVPTTIKHMMFVCVCVHSLITRWLAAGPDGSVRESLA